MQTSGYLNLQKKKKRPPSFTVEMHLLIYENSTVLMAACMSELSNEKSAPFTVDFQLNEGALLGDELSG